MSTKDDLVFPIEMFQYEKGYRQLSCPFYRLNLPTVPYSFGIQGELHLVYFRFKLEQKNVFGGYEFFYSIDPYKTKKEYPEYEEIGDIRVLIMK